MRTDNALKLDVLEELDWDPRVDEAHVGVTASDGVITLSGRVRSFPERLAAVEAATRVRGVRAVADELRVRVPPGSRTEDGDLAERIHRVLEWSGGVPRQRVQAKVGDGRVTLTGEVEWEHQRRHIEQLVRHVAGVAGVSNAIALTPRTGQEDICEDLGRALRRHAGVEASRISLSVADDTVTLKGKVGSLLERDRVKRAAWSAPGVRHVVDRLQVRFAGQENGGR